MKSNIRVSISSCTTPPEAELALQVTITNWGKGQKEDQKKKKQQKIRIYSKIFLLKKLISTIFLQEKKV